MKVAFVTPHYRLPTRGNAVTVRRLERHLSAGGCQIRVFPPEECTGAGLLGGIRDFGPDCIHAFHAFLGGVPARQVAIDLGIPYVVTITGTDIYGESGAGIGREVRSVLAGAAVVTVFHDSIGQRLVGWLPELAERISVVPQGVAVPADLPPEVDGDFVFLLPAGIRPVKNVLFPLAPLSALHDEYPLIRLRIVGPLLDEGYGERMLDALAPFSWASYGGERPFAQMADEYAAAHVVLNTSLSEGGMANSLLEAMAAGRPVLASDIEGNRSLIGNGVNGLLYFDEADFREKAEHLLAEPALRRRLGVAGRRHVSLTCSSVLEAEKYLEVYGNIVEQMV